MKILMRQVVPASSLFLPYRKSALLILPKNEKVRSRSRLT